MNTHPIQRVRFGAFELDLNTGELRSIEASDPENPGPNRKVLLREQVFQVLRMLVEREGKIVTREEIKSRLWSEDTVVDFDQSINATVKSLRRALGDPADNPRYIETLGRRGFRWMPAIEWLASAPRIVPGDVAVEARAIKKRGRWVWAASALLAVGALGRRATRFIAIASLLLPPTRSCWPTSTTERTTLIFWKDADPDVPVYRQAKAEYAQLKSSANQTG